MKVSGGYARRAATELSSVLTLAFERLLSISCSTGTADRWRLFVSCLSRVFLFFGDLAVEERVRVISIARL